MLCRVCLMVTLGFTLVSWGLAVPVAAQSEEDPGFGEDAGGAGRGRRGNFQGRGEGQDQGNPGDRGGQGFRGRGGPRPNPIFEALDADGDGMITPRELRQAVKALKSLDADGDGNISLEEVTPPRGPGGPGGPGGRGGDPSAMIDRLMENDTNGDGQLTQDEIPERMAQMLTGADTNGDGAIDRDELTKAMQSARDNFGRGGGGFGGGGFGGGGFGGRGMSDPDTMSRQIMSMDRNGDGVISKSEMNPQMAGMLQGADTNGDGALNAKEVRIAVETAQQRMQQFRGQGGGGRAGVARAAGDVALVAVVAPAAMTSSSNRSLPLYNPSGSTVTSR